MRRAWANIRRRTSIPSEGEAPDLAEGIDNFRNIARIVMLQVLRSC